LDDPLWNDLCCSGPTYVRIFRLFRFLFSTILFDRGIAKNHNLTFLVSVLFSIGGSVLLLIGASLWTVMIKKSQAINTAVNPLNQVKIGITVSEGNGLFILWAAFVCLFVSVIPYVLR
jgi:hypothetical protein